MKEAAGLKKKSDRALSWLKIWMSCEMEGGGIGFGGDHDGFGTPVFRPIVIKARLPGVSDPVFCSLETMVRVTFF